MALLGVKLPVDLRSKLPVDICAPHSPLARFSNANITQATPRYHLLNGIMEYFTANNLAKRFYNGHWVAQIEGAETEIMTRTQEIDHSDWTKLGGRLTITPDDSADPVGNLTADKITPTVDDDTHLFRQQFTPDGSSTYIFSFFAEDNGYDWAAAYVSGAAYPSSSTIYLNVKTGAPGTIAGIGKIDHGIISISNGMYLLWWTMTSDAAVLDGANLYVAEDNDVTVFAGDGVKSVNFWQVSTKKGKYFKGPIKSVATPAIKDADQVYWGPGEFNPRIGTRRHKVRVYPNFKSHYLPSAVEYRTIYNLHSGSGDIDFRYNRDTRRFEINRSGTNPTTDPATFDWQQPMELDLRPQDGTIALLNAETGATIAAPDATAAWDGDIDSGMSLYWGGQNDGAAEKYFDGNLSEPFPF